MSFVTHWFKDYIHLKPGRYSSGEEVIDTIKEIWEDRRYNPFVHQIWDFSNTEVFILKSADLQALLKVTRNKSLLDSSVNAAIIAPKPSVFYRMQAVVSYPKKKPCNSKVFANMDTAYNWLGILA